MVCSSSLRCLRAALRSRCRSWSRSCREMDSALPAVVTSKCFASPSHPSPEIRGICVASTASCSCIVAPQRKALLLAHDSERDAPQRSLSMREGCCNARVTAGNPTRLCFVSNLISTELLAASSQFKAISIRSAAIAAGEHD